MWGNYAPEYSNQAVKKTRKYMGCDKTYKRFQKNFVPGKNIVINESTVGFKHKIIFETYNPKPNEAGHQIICIS
jgi:hypothetical protein